MPRRRRPSGDPLGRLGPPGAWAEACPRCRGRCQDSCRSSPSGAVGQPAGASSGHGQRRRHVEPSQILPGAAGKTEYTRLRRYGGNSAV